MFLKYLWENGILGKVAVIGLLLIAGILVWIPLRVANEVFSTKEYTVDKPVEGKEFIPSRTITTYVLSGKVLVPIITYIPEKRNLFFKIEDEKVECRVLEETYNKAEIGDSFQVTYSKGPITGTLHCVSLKKSK